MSVPTQIGIDSIITFMLANAATPRQVKSHLARLASSISARIGSNG